jgi:Mce-associated membrane protein
MEKDTVSADGNPNNGLPATVIPDPRPGADDLPAEPDGAAGNGRAKANGDASVEGLTGRPDDEAAHDRAGANGETVLDEADEEHVVRPGGEAADGQAEVDGGDSDAADEGPSDEPEGKGAEEDDGASDETDGGGTAGSGRRSRVAWLRNPLVLALVLALAGGVLLVRASQIRGSAAAENRALTDVERTEMVIGDVSNSLGKVFSYSYTNTAVTEQAARDVLAGRAFNQYQTLFGQVKQRAAAQRLTLTSRVVRAGVVRMTGDTAQLLVFLDQTVHRKDKPNGMTAAAQLSVTARLSDGHWQIVDIQAR